MSQARRSNSRNSQTSSRNGNQSNSNSNKITQSQPSEVKSDLENVKRNSGLKVLGKDGDFSEDILYNNDVPVLMSNRSQPGSRPVSSGSRRTPTPSKQISLQAVKRREEKDEALEEIDWNDFKEPVDTNFNGSAIRVPPLPNDDFNNDDQLSPRSNALFPEELENMIHKRENDMMSALSSARIDEAEADISRKLDAIELEREEIERKDQTEEQDYQLRKSEHDWKVEDSQFTYHNEHFRDLSKRDQKDRISGTFIFDGVTPRAIQSGVREVTVGTKPDGNKPQSGKSSHAMDGPLETAVASQMSDITEKDESAKKDEAAADVESSSEQEEEEEDLIGERGTAPTALLMEFLSCMMQGDYETAEKLCKMILIYEPDNPEALSFYPLIQEKIKQDEIKLEKLKNPDAEESSEGSSDDSDDSGEDEEGSDDDDEDDDDDDESDEDEDEESDEDRSDGDNQHMEGNPDSGIASANSD